MQQARGVMRRRVLQLLQLQQLHGLACAGAPAPDIWYGPNPFAAGAVIRTDFFGNCTQPDAANWPQLAASTSYFKIFLDMLYGPPGSPGFAPGMGSTDGELRALIAVLKVRGIKTGVEVGGTGWSAGHCSLPQALAYAKMEQKWVGRWLALGGTIDSLTTDHANVKNIRRHGVNPCVPAVPMATRIDIVAQVFGSWRSFLGKPASLGFIESLGFWDITGPDGNDYNNTDPTELNPTSIPGWIPRLEDVTTLLLAAAEKHNPTPEVPLIDHYFIDFSLEGVEYDTRQYGTAPPVGVNYNRVLGAEAIMHRHNLKTGIFLNAFHDRSITNCTTTAGCSESAASRTLNYTEMYMQLPARMSEHAVLEQWQPFPNTTGPETAPNTGMWMASACAAAITGGGGGLHGKTDDITTESGGDSEISLDPTDGTMCCNWRAKPLLCGIGVSPSWLCHADCKCPGAGWMPESWVAEAAAGDLLPGSPDLPGGTVANGYVGAWVPRGLPGSAGSAVCGVEHVKGVFAPADFPPKLLYGQPKAIHVSLAALASWTATSFVGSIGGHTLPATTAAMDLRRGAYRVASRAAGVECVQNVFAHRKRQHLLISEFECTNKGKAAATITIQEGQCNPLSVIDDWIYATLCPTAPNGSKHGYHRTSQQQPSGSAVGAVSCSLSAMAASELPGDIPAGTLGECHTVVPRAGLEHRLAAGETILVSLISARYSNMDDGLKGAATAGDPVEQARQAWTAASASGATLFAEHVAAMDELHAPGLEVEGNLELARLVNSSMHALLGSYRNDSHYSSAPEGLVSTRYSGHAFWDVETWQWPTWLVFWPDQAAAALEYRVSLMGQARLNAAGNRSVFLHDFNPGDPRAPRQLEGLRYPWESALSGAEQCTPSDENHIVGDIATAFRQYFRATHDVKWLRESGFPVLEGIAQYYASRVTIDPDGKRYHTYGQLGPDEYHGNITDSAYGNAVGAQALRAAYDYARLIGKQPNETFKRIADGLVIPYNSTLDYHPEYDEALWNARAQKQIKQADTVLMYYPLGINASASTRRNDVRRYAALQDPHGVAMTWGIQCIASLGIGDIAAAATYFNLGWKVFTRPPFYTWHEGNATEGSSGQGAPNLVTAAGGFLQSVWAGYGGIRFERDDALTIRAPRPLPNSTGLRLRGVHFLGARLDVAATKDGWTVALSPTSPESAPQLELVMLGGGAALITHAALAREAGTEGYVRTAEAEAAAPTRMLVTKLI